MGRGRDWCGAAIKISEIAGDLGLSRRGGKRFIADGRVAWSARLGNLSKSLFGRLLQTRRIAGHGVDLKVDAVAYLSIAPCRHRQRMVDQEDVEAGAVDLIDG